MSGIHEGMSENASSFGHFNISYEHWSTMNDSEKDIIAIRVVPIIFMVIFVTGIFGNALVVYVFVRNKAFRTVTNIFLLNLALVDLVYLCFCCPFTTVKVLVMYWPFGNMMCKMVQYLMVVFMSVNVMTLTAIGFDRYFVIVHPKRVRSYRTPQNTCYIIIALWVFSFLVFSWVLMVVREVKAFRPICVEEMEDDERKAYSACMFIFFYLIPQTLVGFCYIQIAQKLRAHLRRGARLNQAALVTLKIRGKIVKMTFVVTLAFAVCWLPLHVAAIMNSLNVPATTFSYHLQLFAPCFAYITVSLNPAIYCFMSKTFRKFLRAAFTCRAISLSSAMLGEDAELIPNNQDMSNSSKHWELRSITNNHDKSSHANGSIDCTMNTQTETSSVPENLDCAINNLLESSSSPDNLVDKECQTEKTCISQTTNI
ncbi:galanin receptor type 1-like [Saccostrea cucullata]|uniref:galanin receptor type 1-like n=1 Tax=Saccostrea cuccullata TaxID=36930 RepID=UPI002ED0D637